MVLSIDTSVTGWNAMKSTQGSHQGPLEKFSEHLKAHSPIYDHSNITGHTTTLENFSIVRREDQNLIRLVKESMYIRVNKPSLNRNIGKYHLPHKWDEVLLNNIELKTKIK